MEINNQQLIQIDWNGPFKLLELPDLMDENEDYGIDNYTEVKSV